MDKPPTVVLPDGKRYCRVDDFIRWEHQLGDGEKPPKSLRNSIYNRCNDKNKTLPSRLFRGRRYILWEE